MKETSAAARNESAVSSSSDSDVASPQPMTQYRARTYSRQSHNDSSKRPTKPISDQSQEPEDDSPPFLPFSAATVTRKPQRQPPNDPSATLRITSYPQFKSKTSIAAAGANVPDRNQQQPSSRPVTSHSSSSSTQSSQPLVVQNPSKTQRQTPLSSLSPRQRRQLQGTTSGSEGNSGIGSSFSDLDDDFSGTQSALEEALAGEMERGGVASRMSTLSQALRSKYL